MPHKMRKTFAQRVLPELNRRIVEVFVLFSYLVIVSGCSQIINKEPLVRSSVIQAIPSVMMSMPIKQSEPISMSRPTQLVKPSLSPVPEPSGVSPTPSPQTTAKPLNTNSICPLPRSTLEGRVQLQLVDESKALLLLSQTTIMAQSLEPWFPYNATTEVKGGLYRFENFPLNTSVEIRIFKETYLVYRKIVKLNESTNISPQNLNFKIKLFTVPPEMDIGITERRSIYGMVVDERGNVLAEAKVSVMPLTISILEDEAKIKKDYRIEFITDTHGKYFGINLSPTLEQVQITASKPGFASVSHFADEISANKQGDPNLNRYNFGLDFKGEPDKLTALADAPLVIDVGLTQTDETHVNPATAFKLTFSEPMNKTSVEKNFILKVFELEQKPDEQKLSCIPPKLGENQPIATFRENDFMAIWNTDLTEVDFRLKTHLQLPSPDKVWIGQITFTDQIYDVKGTARTKEFFRLNTTNMQDGYWFIIGSP